MRVMNLAIWGTVMPGAAAAAAQRTPAARSPAGRLVPPVDLPCLRAPPTVASACFIRVKRTLLEPIEEESMMALLSSQAQENL